MAEVAGLVVGAVGLAGLIGAFKDAIDLFNDFANSRDLKRDYEILNTKLEIERTILLQWAEHVKILRPDYDRRLDDLRTQQAVASILACIRILLSDGSKWKVNYGVVEAEEQQHNPEIDHTSTISNSRMEKFVKEFKALELRMNTRTHSVPLHKRIQWVIRDKEKFDNLVKELARFVTKLNQIMPLYQAKFTTQSTADEIIAAVQNPRKLSIILEASCHHREAIAESAQQHLVRICQVRILRRLWFRRIDDRKESIKPAHGKTLRWILEPPSSENAWDDLCSWLQTESGIYWVSGKAGSGKSTLMKHLYNHPKTRELLSQWASGTTYSFFHFFFWNLGTSEQKSQEGLSRALLYQILSSHRSLIAEVLPNMWRQLCDTDEDVELPSVAETRYAFEIIAKKSSRIGKFCFLIDGLDEFVGNYLDGIDFIKSLAVNKHVKILVSSRPVPECVASFGGLPNLKLHYLTRPDISEYVHDVVGGHEYMQRLMNRRPTQAVQILEDVVEKSSGVFLWVILACSSLVFGLTDNDRISELQRRVDELPPELWDMFQHMLSRVDNRNRGQGARLLRLCHAHYQASNSLHVKAITTLSLALLDDDSFDKDQIRMLTQDQKHDLCKEMESRLRSRCGGLLELNMSRAPPGAFRCFCGSNITWALNDQSKVHDLTIDSEVVFMHRTVFEFLNDHRVWELDCLRPPAGFAILSDLSLGALYSATLKSPPDTYESSYFLSDGLKWGRDSDQIEPNGRSNIFWHMSLFLDGLNSSSALEFQYLHHMNISGSTGTTYAAFILAIEMGAVNYVQQQATPAQLAQWIAPRYNYQTLFFHAITGPVLRQVVGIWQSDGYFSHEMADILLSSGCDPNLPIFGETPWELWLKKELENGFTKSYKLESIRIASTFLKAGAIVHPNLRRWIANDAQQDSLLLAYEEGRELIRLVERLEKDVDTNNMCPKDNVPNNQTSEAVSSDTPNDHQNGSPATISRKKRTEADMKGDDKQIYPFAKRARLS